MNLNSYDLTQGGQVAFMRLCIFLQINNIIFYYIIMSFMVMTIVNLFIRVSTQNIIDGLIYWYSWSVNPLLKNSVNPTCYTLNYYGKKLNFTTDQIINDAHDGVFSGNTNAGNHFFFLFLFRKQWRFSGRFLQE